MLSWPCAGTMQPLPTEPVTFPALCLAGRLPEQQNATVNLDLTHAQVGWCIQCMECFFPLSTIVCVKLS